MCLLLSTINKRVTQTKTTILTFLTTILTLTRINNTIKLDNKIQLHNTHNTQSDKLRKEKK